jgi:hypothetical protein
MTLKNINKPHLVISRTYYQSNKTISRPPQSRETIPYKTSMRAVPFCKKNAIALPYRKSTTYMPAVFATRIAAAQNPGS